MIFVMSGSASDDNAAAAAPPAATALVFGFVPVSLADVWTVAPFDRLVEVADGLELEDADAAAATVVVLEVEAEVAAGGAAAPSPAAAAVAADGGGGPRFSLVTTLEYCCISITAASNNT